MDDKIVTLSIGGGGRQTSNFIKDIILKYFDNEILSNLGDASHVETSTNTAFTTDSFVIRPEFFNGGNIGKLAICGTINTATLYNFCITAYNFDTSFFCFNCRTLHYFFKFVITVTF